MARITQLTRTADHAEARQIVISFSQEPGTQKMLPSGIRVIVSTGTYSLDENGDEVFSELNQRRIIIPYEELSAGDKTSIGAFRDRLLAIAFRLEGLEPEPE